MRLFQKKKMGENPPLSPNHKVNENNNASASPSRFQMMQQQHIKHTQASMTVCSVATSTAGLHSSPSVRTQSTCDSSCFSSGGTSLIQYDSDDEGIGLTSSSSIEEYGGGSGGGGLRTLSAEELKKHEDGWKTKSSGGGRRERERLKLAFDNIRSERMGEEDGTQRSDYYEGRADDPRGSRGSRHESSFSSGLDGFQEWEKDLEGMDKDVNNSANVRHGKVSSNESGGFSKDIRSMDVVYKADSGRDEYREQARPDKKTNEEKNTVPPPNKVTAKPPREEKTNRKSVVVLGLGVVKDENNNNKESKTRTKDKRRHSSSNGKDKKDKTKREHDDEAPSCVVSIPKSRASNIRRSQNAGTPSRAGRSSHHTNGRHGSIGSGGNKSRPSGGPRMSRQAAKKRDESLHGNAYLVRQRVERMKNEELERQRLREAEVAAQHVIPEHSSYVPDRAADADLHSAEEEGKRNKSDDKKTKEQKVQNQKQKQKQQRRSIQRAPPDLSIQESVDEADNGMEIVHLTRPELRRSILEKNLDLFDRSEC